MISNPYTRLATSRVQSCPCQDIVSIVQAPMKPGQKDRQRGAAGFSALERFANAKTSTYDKQRRKEKEFALNAKKVNKYRKLKQRLTDAGRLQPNIPATEEVCRAQYDVGS